MQCSTNLVCISAVASVSLPASTFTSAYSHYKIIFNVTSKVTATTVLARMRAAGTDNTATNYNGSIIEKQTNATAITGYNKSNENSINTFGIRTGGRATIEIYSPQETSYTSLICSYVTFDGTANGANDQGFMTYSLSVTTSYDSMTFFVASGSITGNYSVYGFNI